MTNLRTKVYNAYETTLSATMASTADTCQVVAVGEITADTYLCIEPDDPTKREYVRIGSVNSPNFNGIVRYLAGSAAGSGLVHPSGSVVRSVALQQMWEDAHDRIDFYIDHGNHSGLGDDDHNNYLNNARHDQLARHVPGIGLPVDAPGASAVGDIIAIGTSLALPRADHRHGREAFGIPGASAPGDVAAEGVAITVPRSDHVHGRESGIPVLYAHVTRHTEQVLNTNSAITWTVEITDVGGFWSAGAPTRLTIPADGLYLVAAQATINLSAGGDTASLSIVKNAGEVLSSPSVNDNEGPAVVVEGFVPLIAGDFLECKIIHNSGFANPVGKLNSYFTIARIGA